MISDDVCFNWNNIKIENHDKTLCAIGKVHRGNSNGRCTLSKFNYLKYKNNGVCDFYKHVHMCVYFCTSLVCSPAKGQAIGLEIRSMGLTSCAVKSTVVQLPVSISIFMFGCEQKIIKKQRRHV